MDGLDIQGRRAHLRALPAPIRAWLVDAAHAELDRTWPRRPWTPDLLVEAVAITILTRLSDPETVHGTVHARERPHDPPSRPRRSRTPAKPPENAFEPSTQAFTPLTHQAFTRVPPTQRGQP
jgi:hypothetical protein